MPSALSSIRVSARVKTALLLGGLLVASGFVLMAAGWDGESSWKAFDQKGEVVKQVQKGVVDTVLQEDGTSCQRTCDLSFNACKFTDQKAQTTCELNHTSCLTSCPSIPSPEKETDLGIIEGPSVTPWECQPELLYPVRANASYLILTRSMFVDALRPFVQAKRRAGEVVETVLIENIVCSEPGDDVPEKIRHFLRRQSEASIVTKRPVYVLLVGAPRRLSDVRNVPQASSYGFSLKTPWELPMRYVYPLSGQIEPIPTDQYYASVFVDWDRALQPYYREVYSAEEERFIDRGDHWAARFDFSTNFLVGRVPVRTVSDLTNWIQKTLNWRTPQVFTESKFTTSACRTRRVGLNEQWEDSATHQLLPHVCQTDEGGDIATYANRELPDLITSYSHGAFDGIIRWPFTFGYEFSTSSPGLTKAPILFVHGCEVGGIDFPQLSLAESTIGRRDGSVAFIGSTRSHWDYAFPIPNSIFHKGRLTLGDAFYHAKQDLVSENRLSYKLIDNLFMYTLYGDPALQIVSPSVKITASPPVAFVPARVATEEYSLPIRVQSLLTDRELTGQLFHFNTVGDEVHVPPVSTVRATLRSPIIPLGYPVTGYSVAKTITFFDSLPVLFSSRSPVSFPHIDSQACNTRQMSCIAADARVSAPLQLGCGRMYRTFGFVDGIRQQIGRAGEVQVIRQAPSLYTSPVAFILKMRSRGYFATADEYFAQPLVEVARTLAAPPTTGGVYSFTFGNTPTGERNTGERPGRHFIDAQYEVEARDATDHVVGHCAYVFENDIEPANP